MYTFTQPLTRALDTAAGSCAVLCGALPEEILKAAIDLIPMHALGKPGDVAEAVRYLLSDEAHYLTGAHPGGWRPADDVIACRDRLAAGTMRT